VHLIDEQDGLTGSQTILFIRCTSSMNRMVWLPVSPSSVRAASMAARTSLTPAETAESSTNRRRVTRLTT